ncbi:MAG: hypothetical protein KAY46_20650 [Burkholderiaceae bacterium]|nr:hypothetical protein [Burkholderiaceae bacterium]
MILGRLLRVLASRIWLVLAILAITVAATIAGTLMSAKRYVATSSMLLELPSKDPLLGSTVYLQGSLSTYLASQIELIGSERVVNQVIADLDLTRDPSFGKQWAAQGANRAPIEAWLRARLPQDLRAEAGRDAPLIKVSYEAGDPALAARVANGFVKAYIDATLGLRTQPARDYASLFESQANESRRDLAGARDRLSRFQRETGITSNEESRDVESTRLQELSTQLVQLEAAAAAARSREQTMRNSGRDAMPEVVSNLTLAALKTDIGRLRGRVEEQSARLGAAHPQMVATQAELADLNRRYETELGRITQSIAIEATISEQKLSRTRAMMDAQRASVLALKKQRDQLAELQRDVDERQKTVDLLSQRHTQTNVEANLRLSNVNVLASATPPAGPARPRPLINVALGTVLGLLLGAFAAIALEKVQRPVRDAHDLALAAGVPVLGVLGNAQSNRPQRLIEDAGPLEPDPGSITPFELDARMIGHARRSELAS